MELVLNQCTKYQADQNIFATSKIIKVNLQWKIKLWTLPYVAVISGI